MRNTIQKEIIKDALFSLANHPTADEVYAFIHAKHPTVSKATVYRVLGAMAETGHAKRYVCPHGADFFDHNLDNHYHLKCEDCGRVFDIDIPFMESLNENKNSDVTIFSHQIIFSGICKKCKRKGD